MAEGGASAKSFARRDLLLDIQEAQQEAWAQERVFEVDAPVGGKTTDDEKYFGNFPYPYMNGLLHLGHAFSLSKLEFAAAFHRLCGRKTLFPQGFHCTGMPIKACADKIKREIALFGNPPSFPQDVEEEPKSQEDGADETEPAVAAEGARFSGKKSKAVAKSGKAKYQWQIMEMSGIPTSEIAEFQDSMHWLEFFPPLAMRDIKAMGCGVDWRRSFITTEVNPFYDSFVRWQMRKLRAAGKIVKAKRHAIFSPLDGQPCADHDRASGEGVNPQEYVLIKMELLAPFPAALKHLEGKMAIYLAAATLRPETMYGQTNAWVLPDGEYGAYEISNGDCLVVTPRAARNLSYQDFTAAPGEIKELAKFKGKELIGCAVKAALAIHERIYVLPLLTVSTAKGTGVVTSVPSDAPDDYMGLQDLKNKADMRERLGVKEEWLDVPIVPVVDVPEYGNMCAPKICNDLKIKSQKDKDKLAEAKKISYQKGFYEGTMIVGPYNGKPVQEAKQLVKDDMIKSGQALPYAEPEKMVMSRSGDECVVALTDQWYITYGESEWKKLTEECLKSMNVYHPECRHSFEATLSWLSQWACSRAFGLGTKVPWDEDFLVESLSDSTIYMAYYTVAHILHYPDIYGKKGNMVNADDLTDDVWDYVFLSAPMPASKIPASVLESMRREFEYWYPFDLRTSGKDLIQNHLTFSMYTHTAIWPKEKWPKSFRTNGHLLLNGEKMSKSTGNFLTLEQAIKKYSADAMRLAMADAGDLMDDANFSEDTANATILKLTKELTWIEEMLQAKSSLREGELKFFDRVFQHEVSSCVETAYKSYNSMMFREALKASFFSIQNARDTYRVACGENGMHLDIILRFIEISAKILAPICPHYCDHIYRKLLGNSSSVLVSGWPQVPPPNPIIAEANSYLMEQISGMRKTLQKQLKGKCADKVDIIVAPEFTGWHVACLKSLKKHFHPEDNSFGPDADILSDTQNSDELKDQNPKQMMKQVMPFMRFQKAKASVLGHLALETKLPFCEKDVLVENSAYICRSIGIRSLRVISLEEADVLNKVLNPQEMARSSSILPGNPLVIFRQPPPKLKIGDSLRFAPLLKSLASEYADVEEVQSEKAVVELHIQDGLCLQQPLAVFRHFLMRNNIDVSFADDMVMDLLSIDANEEAIKDLISNGRVSDTVRALAEACVSKPSTMMDTS